MKKILSILAILAVFTVNAQNKIQYPFGNAQNITVAVTGTTAVTAINQMSYVGTVPTLTANIVYSVTPASYLKPGAIMLLTVKTTSTETTTFAGSIVAPVITGSAGKTWSQAFIYNGTLFYPCGTYVQVD